MKKIIVLILLVCAASLRAEKISLVGATVINPADGKVLPNATVVINGDKIERVSMGKQDAATLGKQIDCVGKFILPGYIDTHVHFFQSARFVHAAGRRRFQQRSPLQRRSRVDQIASRRRVRALHSLRNHQRGRCRRADVEFRSPPKGELNRESAARCGRRSANLQRLARETRSRRSADCEDRHVRIRRASSCANWPSKNRTS